MIYLLQAVRVLHDELLRMTMLIQLLQERDGLDSPSRFPDDKNEDLLPHRHLSMAFLALLW